VIAARRLQRNFADGFIAEAVEDLWEPWMRHAYTALEDDGLLLIIQQELAKRCKKSKTRGRKATPAEVVVLRRLLLKHVRDWSYETLSREVRANLVYREFTRIGGEKVPDDRTMGNLARQLGPEVIEKLHRRVVEIAQENKIATGRKMRVDTTVVETDIHYPTDSTLRGARADAQHEESHRRGGQGWHANARPQPVCKAEGFGDCARQPEQDRARPAEDEERLRQTIGNHQPGCRSGQEVFERNRRRRQTRQSVRTAPSQEATR